MLCVVKVRRTVLLCTAISFAAVDLVHKLLTPTHFHHVRAPFVLVVMIGLVLALVLLVPRVPSNAAAVGAVDGNAAAPSDEADYLVAGHRIAAARQSREEVPYPVHADAAGLFGGPSGCRGDGGLRGRQRRR